MASAGEVLVTGGAGYIGSHTVLALIEAGYAVRVVDNFDNSSAEALERVKELAGADAAKRLAFHELDLCDYEGLKALLEAHPCTSCIHFAGLKAVGESVAKPLRYYSNNVTGTLNLLELLPACGCKRIVFSSSATVYGEPASVPATESFPLKATNPYGRTKLFIEEIMRDVHVADPEWCICLLRYFNPVGSHPSGRIGEDPKGIPNNLMPFVQQVAVGRRPELTVFGSDYPTVDGTGVRDYIHVMDLADGHVAALGTVLGKADFGCKAINLGTGKGSSVLQIVKAFEEASGVKIPYKLADRRPGDCAEVYAATDMAERELGWKAKRGLEEMCRDQWNWASNNPYGYAGAPEP